MLRFIDGFDAFDSNNAKIKYNAYTATFDQDVSNPGRDNVGSSFGILNTANGEANYMLAFPDAQGTWGFHHDIQFFGLPLPTSDIWRWSISGTGEVQLSLRFIADGSLRLLDKGGHTIATSSPGLIVQGTWYTLEVKATFGGTGNAIVRLNGATVVSGAYLTSGPVNQMGFRYQNFGNIPFLLDNLVIWDGQTLDAISDFTGRLRVNTLLPTRDARLVWAPTPGPSAWAMVNDTQGRAGGSPDGDLSYITPGGSGAAQLCGVSASPCFGAVYGLALTVAMRPNGGIYPASLVTQPLRTLRVLGSVTPASSAYAAYQSIAAISPETSARWTDAEISGAWWGISTDAAATARVTAFHVEKVTSLVAQPYDCGGGSYSF